MKTITALLICAIPALAVSPKVATASAVTTIAVNVLTIDKTAKATLKGIRVAKRATVKAAKKVAGK